MAIQEDVYNYLKETGEAMKAGEIAEALDADKKAVSAALTFLKAEQRIKSPKRCYYQA